MNNKTSLYLKLLFCIAFIFTFITITNIDCFANEDIINTVNNEDNVNTRDTINNEDIIILFTNDVHNEYLKNEGSSLGYASIAAYKKELEAQGHTVILVDCGDAIQGGIIGMLSKGQYIADIMEEVGYTIAIPGNHEFDFGMENFLSLANSVSYDYISCNFIDLKTNKTVLEPYKIIEIDGKKIAFIGISTPESLSKSAPKYFQDEEGNFIYEFCEDTTGTKLYNTIQKTIDEALANGADYIIALGHIGIDDSSAPWRSTDIISNTTCIDVFLDGHSHSEVISEIHKNKNNEDVLLSQTGSKLSTLGKLTISSDGDFKTELISDIPNEDPDAKAFIDSISASFESMSNEVVAKSEINLITNDPITGNRIIRMKETNLGNLCADAYRTLLGADIAFINGGGIRAEINSGNITYGQIIAVNPYGNTLCMIEASGQQILDALEAGMENVGIGEDGSYLHVSGITFDVNTSIPSSVKRNEKGEFISINGEYRVSNVCVNGEPLDINKTYTLASHNYMLKNGGGGYTMLNNSKLILDEIMLDYEALIRYITENLNGVISKESIYANIYGTNRCNVISSVIPPETSDNTKLNTMIILLSAMAITFTTLYTYKQRNHSDCF